MIVIGIPVSFLQWGTIILWITEGNCLPFVGSLPVLLIYAIWILAYCFKRVAYTNTCLNDRKDYRAEFAQNEDDAGKLMLVKEKDEVLSKLCRQDIHCLNRY